MADKAPYRCLKILEYLFRRVVEGQSLTDLSDATGYAPPVVLRDLTALGSAGWVQQLETGNWAVTTKPAALLRAYELSVQTSRNRLEDFTSNVQTSAMRLIR